MTDPSPIAASGDEIIPVSVVIPTYGRAEFLEIAIASALGQRPRPLEVVVVDDASPTVEPAERAAAAGARVIRQECNQGPAVARNTGVEAARGEWIALLDSDDEWMPGHLARLWSHRDGASLVSSPGVGTDDHWMIANPAAENRDVTDPGALVLPSNPIVTSGVLFERAAFVELGGFRGFDTCEDLDLWIRLAERGRVRMLSGPTLLYRQHPSTQLTGDTAKLGSDLLAVIASHRGAEWWRRRLEHGACTAITWDRMRGEVKGHEWTAAIRSALSLLDPVRRLPHLARLLVFRRQTEVRGVAAAPALMARRRPGATIDMAEDT
ncbi:MAG: glycosyltransferase family 2 protein [Acidimicrobiia bacterium]